MVKIRKNFSSLEANQNVQAIERQLTLTFLAQVEIIRKIHSRGNKEIFAHHKDCLEVGILENLNDVEFFKIPS
jgi:hypothetical protein